MHFIQGKWEILATSKMTGDMPSVCEFTVNPDGQTFEGVMHDQKSGKDFPFKNGKIVDDRTVTMDAAMKIGILPVSLSMTSHISEDGNSCQGEAKALMVQATFTGKRVG